jgi:SRSO17 transposase
MAIRFSHFCSDVSALFKTKRHNVIDKARTYLIGLTSDLKRKNMERMDERLSAEAQDYEGMQHFLSKSPWQAERVFTWVARHANRRLGGRPDSLLILDESAESKKGADSVGVGRQHNGRLGKTDNCQVGVYAVLNCQHQSALIDAQLFLPNDWIEDPERCRKVGVPEEFIIKQSKLDLARQMIQRAMERGVEFACCAMDAFYGRDQGLLQWIDAQGQIYCADIPVNTLIFTDKPTATQRPSKMSQAAKRADTIAKELGQEKKDCTELTLREGENGILRAKVWTKRVWVWPAELNAAKECWLIVREVEGGFKISLSNAPADTPASRLVAWQAGRFYVERSFEDAKSNVGMSGYQVRGWVGWCHHMAMVSLALAFIMEERMIKRIEHPLVSVSDIVGLLDWYLCGPRSESAVEAAFEKRQRVRERQGLAAQNRDREKLGLPKINKMRVTYLPK